MTVRIRPAPLLAALASLAFAGTLAAQATAPAPAAKSPHAIATFAGGCFWCMEPPFDKLDGVIATTSGYMGGFKRFPTYEQVSGGTTGHTEVVQIVYDPAKVSYEKLLEVYWVNTDPTVNNEQFCDSGTMYRPAIFTHTPEQKRAAEVSKAALEKTKPFKAPIVTPVSDAGEFFAAEEYHQDYYKKNPARYNYYVTGCGRYARLKQLWGAKAPSP